MDQTKLSKVYDYHCKACNKGYSSYQSYWNHNKKFHNDEVLKLSDNILKSSNKVLTMSDNNHENVKIKEYICRYCNQHFTNIKTRWSHEQKCKIQNNKINNDLDKMKEETKQKELDLLVAKEKNLLLQQEKEILKLKLKLEKSKDHDIVTLKLLNKKLLERNNLIKTINSNNNFQNNSNNIQNSNNVINNTFQLVGFSKEDIVELLTMQEKKQIMNAKFCCLEKLIEIIHCGRYNQFKNIIITNMNNNYMYKYDDEKQQFVLSTKNSVLNSLIDCRVSDIEVIYNELVENNKLDEKTKNLVEKFINKINDNDGKFIDIDDKEYESFRHYKINEVKIILYNNQDKITNDISLMLTTTNESLDKINLTPIIEEIDC